MPTILSESERLYRLGFALLWLHPKSKRPVRSGWTSGPRESWEKFRASYQEGYNVGVRTGTASKLEKGYLACIDVDIKDAKFKDAALERLSQLVGFQTLPEVRSGGGNGSRHLYCVTPSPFKMVTVCKFPNEWEICIYSDGRQMVLPPSIHPDTARIYEWRNQERGREIAFPLMDFSSLASQTPQKESSKCAPVRVEDDFALEPVELSWLDIPDEVRAAIETGEGVLDRSAYLLIACNALLSARLNKNEILSVLTDPETFLGACAYDHAKTNSRKAAARWIWKYTLSDVMAKRDPKLVFKDAPAIERASLSDAEASAQEEEMGANWRDGIKRGKQGGPHHSIQNIVLILNNIVGPDFVRHDKFTVRDIFFRDTPWGDKKENLIADRGISRLRRWLGEEFGFEPSRDILFDSLHSIADLNCFDSAVNAFDALPAWDKKPRLDTWLAENFEAKGEGEYLAQVFRKWMVAQVMRVYHPGAKFDWMPIFEGAQGIGKSSFGRLLCGDKFFSDWLPNLNDKDAAIALQGMRIVEMGELSTMKKNEVDVTKGFLTRQIDKVRLPYGRLVVELERRCVFFGTTNQKTYLKDDTGHRRFKPVLVGNLNFKALIRDREQLYAEAKYLWGEKIETEITMELDGKAKIFEAETHLEKTIKDDSELMADLISDFNEKNPNWGFEKFKLYSLFSADSGKAGPLHHFKLDARSIKMAAKAVRQLGGESWKSSGNMFWFLFRDAPPSLNSDSLPDF